MSETSAVQRDKEQVAVQTTATKAENALDRTNLIFEDIARRAFQIFEAEGRVFGHDIENWFKAEKELFHPVHLDITESDDSILVKAEVPYFTEKELQVSVEPRRLTISGRHESSKEGRKDKTVYSEVCAYQVFRVVDLPAEVNTANVTATLNEGILQLTMPKAAKAATVQTRPQAAA